MIEGIGASQLQGPARPGGAIPQSGGQASVAAQVGRSTSSAASNSVGASDAAPDQSVEQAPKSSSPGPENDFGHRGTLLDIAA